MGRSDSEPRGKRSQARPGRPLACGDATPLIADEAHRRARQYEAGAAISQFALTADDLQPVLDEAVRLVAKTLELEVAAVFEANVEDGSLLLRAGTGWKDGLVGTVSIGPDHRSQPSFTLLANEPVVVSDLRSDRRISGPAVLREHGVVSGMSVVIPGHHQPFGVLSVHAKRQRDFSSNDVHFLRSVANVVAAAVRNREADRALRESEARMRAIVSTAVDAIITINKRGVVDSMNLAAEKILGYAAGAVVGRNVSMLMPQPYSGEHTDT